MSARRLAGRVAVTAVTLLAALVAVHAIAYAMPGDPVRALFGFRSPGNEVIATVTAAYGLDDPYPVQLWRYLSGLVTGDLGPVYRLAPGGLSPTGATVGQAIAEAAPPTLRLVAVALVLEVVFGGVLALGTTARSRRSRAAARATMACCVAIPSFALAAALRIAAPDLGGAAALLGGAACLSALPAGIIALAGQPAVEGSWRGRFVALARANGLPDGRIRWLHALRPAASPVVTLAAAELGNLITALVLVEPILGRPGVGALLISSVDVKQGPLTVAIIGALLVAIAVASLLADVLLTLLDPRVDAV